MTANSPVRHQESAEGDFYVEDGCSLTCGIPEQVAPSVFGWTTDGSQCVVKRQPASPTEVTQTLTAMWMGEVDCIRYAGENEAVARRIVEMGSESCLDGPLPVGARAIFHDIVSFEAAASSARELKASLKTHLASKGRYRVRSGVLGSALEVCWSDSTFHRLLFHRGETSSRWRVTLSPAFKGTAIGLGHIVQHWVEATFPEPQIRWYAQGAWGRGWGWRDTLV